MRDDLEGMRDKKPEWHLARDGQQFGPLSDVKMKKFFELGHLQPTDLVWRKGFSDWTPAGALIEAKSEDKHPGHGLEQGKAYARAERYNRLLRST